MGPWLRGSASRLEIRTLSFHQRCSIATNGEIFYYAPVIILGTPVPSHPGPTPSPFPFRNCPLSVSVPVSLTHSPLLPPLPPLLPRFNLCSPPSPPLTAVPSLGFGTRGLPASASPEPHAPTAPAVVRLPRRRRRRHHLRRRLPLALVGVVRRLAGAPREQQPCRRLTGRRTRCEDFGFSISRVLCLLLLSPLVRFIRSVFCGGCFCLAAAVAFCGDGIFFSENRGGRFWLCARVRMAFDVARSMFSR